MSIDKEPKEFIFGVPTDIHYTQDGVIQNVGIVGGNVDPDRAEEMINHINESNFGSGEATDRAKRLSVGFSKWRSSWDPSSKNDPSLN